MELVFVLPFVEFVSARNKPSSAGNFQNVNIPFQFPALFRRPRKNARGGLTIVVRRQGTIERNFTSQGLRSLKTHLANFQQ